MQKWTIGVLIGSVFMGTTSLASAKDEAVPAYAQTASDIGSAIYQGDDLTQRDDIYSLREAEYNELAKLKGCDAQIQPTGLARMVLMAWNCGEGTSEPGLERTVAMMFDEDGQLIRFAINAPLETFEPTKAALDSEKMPFPRKFATSLGKAIRKGNDLTQGGLIAISEFDRKRLSEFEGGKFYVFKSYARPTHEDVANIQRIRLRNRTQKSSQLVYLYFDSANRPLGLAFAPSRNPDWKPSGRTDNEAGIALWTTWDQNGLQATTIGQ